MDFKEIIETYGTKDNFIVYSASAGTGKTHTITKEELKYIFDKSSSDFSAITFTNAAAREMKERVIEYLIKLAATKDKDTEKLRNDPVYKDVYDNIAKGKKRADIETILLNILNNYSSLTIGTIDSMAVRLLKAYLDKTNLPMDVKVLLDDEEFYKNLIIESLINNSEFSKKPQNEKIEIIKNLFWKISTEQINTNPINTIKNKFLMIYSLHLKTNDINIFETEIDEKIIDKKVKELGNLVKKIINNDAIANELNYQFLNYLKNINESIEHNEILKIQIRDKNKRIFKNKSVEDKIRYDILKIFDLSADIQILQKIKRYSEISVFYKMFIDYYQRVKESLYELPLKSIYYELINSITDSDELSLRLGKDINLFVIDEFQDTSFEQLMVLKPLFDYVLKRQGEVIVVGDTKQSIYRFRGGDYRSLSRLIELKGSNIHSLNKNYRSRKEIVNFIGELFPTTDGSGSSIEDICKTIHFSDKKDDKENNDILCEAFKKAGAINQHAIKSLKDGGYVEINTYGINFLEINNKHDRLDKNKDAFRYYDISQIFEDILQRIKDLRKSGYQYKDIALLTFSNNNVQEIAIHLSNSKIPFKSNSSIDARERNISKEIVSIMKYAFDNKDYISLYQFLKSNLLRNRAESLCLSDEYNKIITNFENNPQQFEFDRNSKIYKEIFADIFENFNSLTAYDALTLIYRVFDITSLKNEQAAYMTLLDAAIKIETEKDNTIKTFIEEFEDKGEQTYLETLSLWEMNIPESVDAVTVSTIHKTKGLEFPIVFYIVPRTKSKDNKEMTILQYNDKHYICELNDNDLLAISYSSLKIDKDDIERQEKINYNVDKINQHYVALTRAIDELYIFLYNTGNSNAETKCLFTSLIYNYLKIKKVFKNDNLEDKEIFRYQFSFGKHGKKQLKSEDLKEIDIETFKIPEFKNIYLQSFLNRDEQARYGTVIHNILSKILFINDGSVDYQIQQAMDAIRRDGIEITNKDVIVAAIKNMLKNDKMRWIFEERSDRVVKNEMEFVDGSGNLYRADRVIIDRDRAYVIDYKSGNPSGEERREYLAQVKNYISIVQSLTGKKTEGRIFYLNSGEVEEI